MSEAAKWTKMEPGWYTHPQYGGVCREHDRLWYVYPIDTPGIRGRGYKWCGEAMAAAEGYVISLLTPRAAE